MKDRDHDRSEREKVWRRDLGGFQSNHEMVIFNMKSRIKIIKRWLVDLEEIQRECS